MGKGDWRRPTLVKDETNGKSWCDSVGHRKSVHGDWCVNCGMEMRDAPAVGEP